MPTEGNQYHLSVEDKTWVTKALLLGADFKRSSRRGLGVWDCWSDELELLCRARTREAAARNFVEHVLENTT